MNIHYVNNCQITCKATIKNTNNTSETSQPKESNKTSNSLWALGIPALLTPIPNLILNSYFVNKSTLLNSLQLKPNDIDLIKNCAEKILDNTGLRNKGVTIKYWEPVQEIKTLEDFIISNTVIGELQRGENAFFAQKNISLNNKLLVTKNSINMPSNNLHCNVFHEIGHAHNYNLSKLGKFAQSPIFRALNLISALSLPIFVAFSSKRTANEGEELSTKDRLHNMARNYAPQASLIIAIPTIAEEWTASIKGENFAKNLLPQKLLSHVKKSNRLALSTYIIGSVSSAIGIWGAKAIKDYINRKKENKTSN